MITHVNKVNEDLDESNLDYDIDKTKKIKWQDRILLNRPLKVITVFTLVAIIAPLILYRYLFFISIDLPPSDGFSFGSCLIARQSRLLCGYGNVTANQCHSECCYDHSNGICFHRFPSRFSYILNQNWSEEVFLTPRISTVPYKSQESFNNIRLSIDEISATHLSLTFYKSDEQIIGRTIEEKKYEYEVSQDELNIIVNGTQGSIFNTNRGPFIASNNIWEMAFKITNESMYGLGEIPLKEDTVKVIYSHRGGLSSIPLIFAKSNKTYHGVLFDTKAPTEIHIRNENQIVIRSITNWGLKFHLFVGPKPVDIMKDVRKFIGSSKKLEYWMLGTHFCSKLNTTDSLVDLETFISTADTLSMPFDSHCGTAPALFNSNCDRDYVKLVDAGVTALKRAGKKFVPHVYPYILYTEPKIYEKNNDSETDTIDEYLKSNLSERCFDDEKHEKYIIRDPESEKIYIGAVDEEEVIYPNYESISNEFMQELWVYADFDGTVLENNWPLDESKKMVNQTHLFLPYFSESFEIAFKHTPQWNATQPEKYLYTHNEYGNNFITAFETLKEAVPTTSTSQWMNLNVIINRQNVETSWSSLQKELIEASLGGISGHWYWSSPVCGDTENFNNSTQVRLCAKWYMAATYFPMIQIYSKKIRRDPLAFVGTDRVHMVTALKKRMGLLPYFYTVLQEGPLLRPMFYQFPYTEELTNLTSQFSVGDDVLIIPNLQPSQSHVHVWMPPGQWYEFWSGLKIEGDVGQPLTMTTIEADFLNFIRGGSIIPIQETIRLTAAETQLNSPYLLIIALHCKIRNTTEDETIRTESLMKDDSETTSTDTDSTVAEPSSTVNLMINECSAKGKLHMSSEMIISFEANSETLTITAVGEDFKVACNSSEAIWANQISALKVYGLKENQNNFDNHLLFQTNLNLCSLETDKKITVRYI